MIYLLLLLICSTHAHLSVVYTQDTLSDMAAEHCINEMYPRHRKLQLQESDGSCIIYCVFRKFRIMNNVGVINLDVFRKHVKYSHHLDQRALEHGRSCAEKAESAKHKQDVCWKAKVFNDCTNLYRIRF